MIGGVSFFDKLNAVKKLKPVFEHLNAIETADNQREKKKAEREWKSWKRKHRKEIDEVKKYIKNEIVRMAEDDKEFCLELIQELSDLHETEEESGFKISEHLNDDEEIDGTV